jgi:hypothetical protein
MSSVKHSKKFSINQPIKIVFPLFSAEGEKLWVPGWDYENIMGSTDLHEDYIFLTKTHDHAATDAIWLVKRYDSESCFVQFYKVEPEDKIGVITVQCIELEKCFTEVEVTYEYTGEWERLLKNYFQSKSYER